MSEAMVRREDRGAMQEYSVQDVLEQVSKIQNVMREVMKDGEHFGVIPGCGKKPSLLKPGAEKLAFTFRLAPRFEGERNPIDLGRGHREYVIRCELVHIPTGTFVGSGVGSCCTMEGKYRYRTGPVESTGRQVPGEYWNCRKTDPQKAQNLLGGPGLSTKKIDGKWEIVKAGEKVEGEPYDAYNTVLKMAKKRALVDAILTATAASDIFTQDVEETVVEETEKSGTAHHESEPPPPVVTDEGFGDMMDAPPQESVPPDESGADDGLISDKQRKRMYAIAKSHKCSDDAFKQELERMGYKSSKDVTRRHYDAICEFFEHFDKQ